MSLDQMFAMLRCWGEQQTAFGQTAAAQRAAAKRESRAEGRKADFDPLPSRPVRAVLETQIERGMVLPGDDRVSLPNQQSPGGNPAANAQP
jgi:hypothetical protein